MAIDAGPATNNATIFSGIGCGIEVHVGNPPSVNGSGIDPLPPSAAPFVDPSQAGSNITGNPVVPLNKTVAFGVTGAVTVFANPA